MFFRSKKQTETVADPVAEAVVSYISNDGYGSAILKTSALYAAVDCIASDVASCRVTADTPTLAKNLSDRNLLFAIVYNMLLNGNAYVAINGNGKFTLIDNNRIESAYDNETNAVKYYVDRKEYHYSHTLLPIFYNILFDNSHSSLEILLLILRPFPVEL